MTMLVDNHNICWYTIDCTAEHFLAKIAISMLKKMFYSYILPFTKNFINFRKFPLILKPQKVNFIKNRKYIATHVKSAYENVKVYVVNNAVLCNEVIERRMKNSVNFVGLDCEWNSSKKSGVALIQISSGSDCILYKLNQTSKELPVSLKTLLEDRKILKFGVAIQEDVRRLRSHGVSVKGFVDLRNVADRCLPFQEQEDDESPRWGSLRSLSSNMLEMKLNKSFHIRCGNWESKDLTKQQILYAAKDAIVSLEIFYALVLLRRANRHSLFDLTNSFEINKELITYWVKLHPLSDERDLNVFTYSHSSDILNELDISIPSEFTQTKPAAWLVELAYSLCQGITDMSYKYKLPSNVKQNIPNVQSRALSTKASTKPYKHQCREKPLYENCFLLGPDKTMLATVNRSKAQWYVTKGLGVIDKESPFTVSLLFEPSGRPMPDADYYTTCKENICVVCGNTGNFVRKMIIPHDYRRYFPQQMKDHMSHDVLLMCLDCHRDSQRSDEEMRQELAHKYNAPLGTRERMQFIDNPQLAQVRSAAKALLHGGSKIPEKRRNELESIVLKYFNVETIDEQLLQTTLQMNIKVENKKFEGLHGERVVKQVIEKDLLVDFVRMWRQHFLDTMHPQYLPPMWSVDHNIQKIANST